MDVDFWASRVHSATHHLSALPPSRHDHHLNLDDSEGGDETRTWFTCPFCYVDIEVHMLCTHLQEEHCFDVKNSVCPVCAANLGKDVIGHFTVQHAHSLKRRRRPQKSGFWTNSSTMVGKEMRELSSFIGSTPPPNGRGSPNESVPDSLFSPFLCSVPFAEPKGQKQHSTNEDAAPTMSRLKRSEPSGVDENDKKDYEERMQRAVFFQQLTFSTIF